MKRLENKKQNEKNGCRSKSVCGLTSKDGREIGVNDVDCGLNEYGETTNVRRVGSSHGLLLTAFV